MPFKSLWSPAWLSGSLLPLCQYLLDVKLTIAAARWIGEVPNFDTNGVWEYALCDHLSSQVKTTRTRQFFNVFSVQCLLAYMQPNSVFEETGS